MRSDLDVISGLAGRLGVATGFDTDPEVVFDELRRASAGGPADYSGIDYGRITRELGVFWPCPDTGDETAHPGTPRLFLDRFATPDGRARFHAVDHVGAAEQPSPDYPFYLTTGRVLAQYQSGAQTRRVRELDAAAPGPFVELHPMVAAELGVADGEQVRVATRRGQMVAPARISTRHPPRHRVPAVPLGRRQPAHQRRPRPLLEDAGVQGLRGVAGARGRRGMKA